MTLTATARAALPVTREVAYLNTASMGPVSSVYAEALAAATAADLANGRAVAARYRALESARERLRTEVAALLDCAPAEIRLTQSTSAGLEAAIGALEWRPGDEVLTTDAEHDACAKPLRRLAEHEQVVVRTLPLDDVLDPRSGAFEAALGPRTRLVALSAVTFETGARLPLDRLVAIARAHGTATLVDGAQCAGAAPLRPARSGVDFLAMPLQKWLLGPEGLGALYVRADSTVSMIEPPADRVTHGLGVLEATAFQLGWLRERLGWDAIFERTAMLAEHARRVLGSFESAAVLTPPAHAGIVTVRCRVGSEPLADRRIAEHGILVRHLPDLDAIRVSTAFFNTESEIDALVELLSATGSCA